MFTQNISKTKTFLENHGMHPHPKYGVKNFRNITARQGQKNLDFGGGNASAEGAPRNF